MREVNIINVNKEDTYGEEITSEQDKKNYNEVYLEGLSAFGYLQMYDKSQLFDFDIETLEEMNPDGLYKTLLAIMALKRKVEIMKPANKIKLKAYRDILDHNEEFIGYIMNLINVYDEHVNKSSEVEDFFK